MTTWWLGLRFFYKYDTSIPERLRRSLCEKASALPFRVDSRRTAFRSLVPREVRSRQSIGVYPEIILTTYMIYRAENRALIVDAIAVVVLLFILYCCSIQV